MVRLKEPYLLLKGKIIVFTAILSVICINTSLFAAIDPQIKFTGVDLKPGTTYMYKKNPLENNSKYKNANYKQKFTSMSTKIIDTEFSSTGNAYISGLTKLKFRSPGLGYTGGVFVIDRACFCNQGCLKWQSASATDSSRSIFDALFPLLNNIEDFTQVINVYETVPILENTKPIWNHLGLVFDGINLVIDISQYETKPSQAEIYVIRNAVLAYLSKVRNALVEEHGEASAQVSQFNSVYDIVELIINTIGNNNNWKTELIEEAFNNALSYLNQ